MNELEEVKVLEPFRKQTEKSTDHYPGLTAICTDKDHRKLAICSIICGLSCFGIMSLMYSVKARETRKTLEHESSSETQAKVEKYSEKACKWGIGAIVAWVCLILIFPFLVVFFSYIVTFID